MTRFKYLMVGGFLCACLAAFFSYASIGPNGFSYRQPEVWSSPATVLVTSPANGTDPVTLASTYAAYAGGDEVRNQAIRMHGVRGKLQGAAGFDTTTQTPLPTLIVSGLASSPGNASILANDGVKALKAFVRNLEAGTPAADRPRLRLLQRAIPFTATVLTPRSKTPPVFAFVFVLAATLGLAFLLENLRPRVRQVPADSEVVEIHRAASDAVRQARDS